MGPSRSSLLAAWARASVRARGLASLVCSASVSAQVGTVSVNHYSAYEKAALDRALREHHTTIDPGADGKLLEGIDIVTLDVFEDRDPLPYPQFFDLFHTKSKDYVIRREILLVPGELYRQALVDDSVRNLQILPALNFVVPQLSLVIAVPTRGSTPDRVRLLVITKDIWSLRPNWDLQATNGGVVLLTAQPAETNVAGTHTIANLNFVLNPAIVTVGAGYTNFRLDGTHLVIQPNANVVWNRSSGDTEGSFGGVIAGLPLYSPHSEWAWDAGANWVDYTFRQFTGVNVQAYMDPTTHQSVPNAFHAQNFGTQYTLTRSFGTAIKNDFTIGASMARSAYTIPATPNVSSQTEQDFAKALVPLSDTRVGPFLQWHTYAKRYTRVLDYETLGLQEDFRVGHEAFVNVYPVAQALGSSRTFVGVDASVLYSIPLGDGLVRAGVESITEAEASELSDASIEPSLHLVSPTALIGRFVFDGHLLYRYRNYLNQVSYLGGDTRLRGYPTSQFAGNDMINANLEFRTHSIDIFTAQLGLVAFFDAGDAFNGWSSLQTYESVGLGARALFPQLDRSAFRFDVGVPVGQGARIPGMPPVSFFFSVGQAFGVPGIGPGGGPGSPQLSGSPTTILSPPP